MVKYVEIALGSIAGRGHAIPISEIAKYQKIAQNTHQELYRSYYFFDYTLAEHLAAYKTVKGYNGSPIIEQLILDIDKNGDTDELVHKRAMAFYFRLKEFDISDINIRVYYSGSGYHFVLPNLWKFQTYQEVKETFIQLFPEADPIYDKSRLIRVSNTINFKSGKYKIPIRNKELINSKTEFILSSAKTIREINFPAFEEGNELEYTKVKPKTFLSDVPKIVTEEGMNPVIVCVQKMYNDGPQKGSRHNTMFRMISAFKRGGVPQVAILEMMKSWSNGEMEIGELRKVVNDHFIHNYSYSCEDFIMKKHCDERCMFYRKKSYNSVIPNNASKLEQDFRVFSTTRSNDYLELQTQLVIPQSFKIYPGETVVIYGDTGLGKSSLVQNWCVNQKQYRTLYVNFEVGETLMYRRELQIAHGMTKEDILAHYITPNSISLADKVSHIDMVSSVITIPVLESLIVNGNYRLIVADTLGGFHIPGITDMTTKTETIAPLLKQIAIKYNIIILEVHHIPKSKAEDSEGNAKKLTKHSGTGSQAVEQQADKIILLEGKDKYPHRRISSAKARDESPFDTQMMFDAERTFRFYKEPIWQNQNLQEISSSSSSETVTLISPGLSKE